MLTFRRNALLSSVLLALVGWIEWRLVSLPPAPPSTVPAQEVWELPQPVRSWPEKAAGILEKTSPWGRLPEPGAQRPLNDPEWRFVGIVARGPESYVLIKIENQPQRQLQVGDELPGGSRILKIDDDSLCVLVDGEKRRVEIYPRGPQAI